MLRQIIIDTETTGLSPSEGHKLIEIAGVELINRQFTGNNFHCYLNPQRSIDPAALAVHGITEYFLRDKPLFADVAADLLEYFKDAELIAHNAKFDLNFLNHEFNLIFAGWEPLQNRFLVTDTLALAKNVFPGQRNNLDALCKRYNINIQHRDLHGAMIDAKLLAQVYLQLSSQQKNIFTTPENKISTETKKTANISELNSKLKILSATEEESLAHQNFLELIPESKSWWE